MLSIINIPDNAKHYEFMVVRKVDEDYWYWGAYADGFKAYAVAQEVNGVVIHNVRIQGYQP